MQATALPPAGSRRATSHPATNRPHQLSPFTSLQPRLAARANFSHSQQRVRQILRDNETLVARLG